MFAVIQTGGKQYLVKPGDTVKVEKLPEEQGKKFSFDSVLLLADENGGTLTMGTPTVAGKTVAGVVESQMRDAKIRVVKYKRKVRYRRVHGHRQYKTVVKIESI